MRITKNLSADMPEYYCDDFDFSELSEMVSINSHTKNKSGVDNLGSQYMKIFETLGFTTVRYSREIIGDHLLFVSSAKSDKKLLLLGHMDTVFPDGTFVEFSEDNNWIYGPGVCDMKGGIQIMINALRKTKYQMGNIYGIDILLVSDEETGSDDSRLLLSKLAKNYHACLVFEAAGVNNEVVIGRKGIATFCIDIHGKAAHAGNDFQHGADANLAAAKIILELSKLSDLARGTTVNAGKLSGGIGANTISPKAQIILEARFSEDDERDRLVNQIELIVTNNYVEGVTASLSGGVQRDVMQPNQKQTEFLCHLESILGESLMTERRGGVSDANIISAMGVPTLDGFGPFGDGDHTIKERACKKSFYKRQDQLTKILAAFNTVELT